MAEQAFRDLPLKSHKKTGLRRFFLWGQFN